MNNNNNNNLFYDGFGLNEFNYNNLQNKYLQQQQYMQRRNSSVNESGLSVPFYGSSPVLNDVLPSKRQKLVTNQEFTTTTATTASTTTIESDNFMSMDFSKEIEKQRMEIDRFINLQNERLKLTIQEQMKRQMCAIFKKIEARSQQLLSQKDNEISQARNKSIELQQILSKIQVENQSWQNIALQNEELIHSLNNQLQQQQLQLQVQVQDCSSTCSNNNNNNNNNNNVDDVESSCCNILEKKNNDEEEEETREIIGICKSCNSRNVCILLLPCRHLCCCKYCDAFVHACPLCKSPKMASVQVLLS